MSTITPEHFLTLSFLLIGIGFLGLLIRRNVLLMLMSLELMLNGINIALLTFSRVGNNLDGGVFVFFIMTVAAAEVAVGLALLVALFKKRDSVFSEDMRLLRN